MMTQQTAVRAQVDTMKALIESKKTEKNSPETPYSTNSFTLGSNAKVARVPSATSIMKERVIRIENQFEKYTDKSRLKELLFSPTTIKVKMPLTTGKQVMFNQSVSHKTQADRVLTKSPALEYIRAKDIKIKRPGTNKLDPKKVSSS